MSSISEFIIHCAQRPPEGSRISGGGGGGSKCPKNVLTCVHNKKMTSEGGEKLFPLSFLCKTFEMSRSENFFHSLKSAFSDDKMVLLELSFQYWL